MRCAGKPVFSCGVISSHLHVLIMELQSKCKKCIIHYPAFQLAGVEDGGHTTTQSLVFRFALC